MTFHVYPVPAKFPLVMQAAETSPPIPLAEPVPPGGGGVQTIFVRCAVWGWERALPAGAEPDVLLVAEGAETPVTSVNGVNPTPVADGRAFATVFPSSPASGGVFRVEVFKNDPGPIGWQIRFRNPLPTGQAAMALMWVAADNAAESRQPWMDVSYFGRRLDARPGQTVTGGVPVDNHGTGPLTITNPAGTTLAPGLSVTAVPPPVPPNGRGSLQVSFTGQSEPRTDPVVYLVTSNDMNAVFGFPRHWNRAELIVTSHPPMPVLAAGDILVSDNFRRLVRVDPSTGQQTAVASGGIMDGAFDVAVEHSGDLVCATNHAVIRIDRASGAFHALTRGALSGARSLAVAADGSVLVVDTDDGQIIRVNPGTGAQSQALAPKTPPALQGGPIVIAPNGTVLMVGSGRSAGVSFAVLVRIDLAAGTSTEMFRKPGFRFDGLAVAPDGVVFVVALDLSGNKSMLIRFSPATGQQTVVFNRPDVLLNRVALTPRGEPLLTGTAVPGTTPSRGVLLRLDPGNVTAGNWAAHEFSAGGQLRMPQGLAVVPPASG